MLPEATYRAVVTDHGWGTSTNGKTQLALCFKVLEGPQAGQAITDYKYFSGKAAEFTFKALRACGWKGNDLENLGKLDQAVDIVIEHEDYTDNEGNTSAKAKVKWVNSPGGTVALKDPLSKDALRMFAASMKSQAASIKEVDGPKVDASQTQTPAGPPSEGPPPSDAPPPGDADIPW